MFQSHFSCEARSAAEREISPLLRLDLTIGCVNEPDERALCNLRSVRVQRLSKPFKVADALASMGSKAQFALYKKTL